MICQKIVIIIILIIHLLNVLKNFVVHIVNIRKLIIECFFFVFEIFLLSAPTLTKLKLHVATHINIKPFMCSICGWRANLRWYIQVSIDFLFLHTKFQIYFISVMQKNVIQILIVKYYNYLMKKLNKPLVHI